MNSRADQSENPIADQAAAWVLREDRGFTPAEQDEFLQWLAADSRHAAELARQRANWQRLDLLGQWRPEHSPRPNRDLLAPPSRPRGYAGWWLGLGSLAVAAALALLFAINRSAQRTTASIEAGVPAVAIATIESRTLPDGSVVELNRGASVAVQFTAGERRVALERGEAHFTVMKDAARPFIVSASGVDVRAVGTAFNVRLGRQAVEVLVTEGKVRVDHVAAVGTPETVVPSLEHGQRSVVPLANTAPVQVAAISAEEMERLLAWQPRMLEFTATPLRSVVAEFNRRNAPVHLVIVDADLAEVEVSATLRSDNVEGFIRLLEAGFGARVERAGDEIRLRR